MKILLILLSVFRVALVGDPQVDNEQELDYARKSIYTELRQRSDLDLILILGDLVNDKPELIAPSEAILDSMPCPWVRLHGNHDGPDPVADTVFVQEGIRFVLMNNNDGRSFEGKMTEPQKQWLDSLVTAEPSRKTVLCMHVPLQWTSGRDSIDRILSKCENLFVVTAHLHTVGRDASQIATEELTAGATCGMWWRGWKEADGIPYALMNCGAPRGYFTADFHSGRRNWYSLRYKCVGRSEDDMASAHVRDGNLLVNVYGGYERGEVRVIAGGKRIVAGRTKAIAPEVQDVIDYNDRMGRDYFRRHRDENMPMRKNESPHLWSAPAGEDLIGKTATIIYRDPHMHFRQKTTIK